MNRVIKRLMCTNQMSKELLFVCSKVADETNLSSKLPDADRAREV